MKTYQPKEVKAVQWMKPGDFFTERDVYPQMIMSREGTYFYLSHSMLNPREWIAVDPEKAPDNMQALPFAFWSLKSGEKIDLNFAQSDIELSGFSEKQRDMIKRGLKSCGFNEQRVLELRPYGVLVQDAFSYREGQRSQELSTRIVMHGEWIVQDALRTLTVCTDAVFKKLFSNAE
jgi:hypothetical protein